MKRKLNCVLLIDDDEPTNYLNRMILEEVGCAEKLVSVQSGYAALDYLESKEYGKYPQPDLIFLDINMPGMNGWEFLDRYKKLNKIQKGRIILVMLTTSLNPDDEEKSKSKDFIAGFMNKPLTIEMIRKVLEKHFADWL